MARTGLDRKQAYIKRLLRKAGDSMKCIAPASQECKAKMCFLPAIWALQKPGSSGFDHLLLWRRKGPSCKQLMRWICIGYLVYLLTAWTVRHCG